jgi:type IV secretory pathway TrbD component
VLIAGNYLMSWLLAIVYARVSANRHDPLVKLVVDRTAADRRPQ